MTQKEQRLNVVVVECGFTKIVLDYKKIYQRIGCVKNVTIDFLDRVGLQEDIPKDWMCEECYH